MALRPTHPKKILTQNLAEGKSNLNKRPLCGTPQTPNPPLVLIPYKQSLVISQHTTPAPRSSRKSHSEIQEPALHRVAITVGCGVWWGWGGMSGSESEGLATPFSHFLGCHRRAMTPPSVPCPTIPDLREAQTKLGEAPTVALACAGGARRTRVSPRTLRMYHSRRGTSSHGDGNRA